MKETKSIMDGVDYDSIVREWRCKWSPDGDKASLLTCQMAIESIFDDLIEIDGVQNVERIVCDKEFDFKVWFMVLEKCFISPYPARPYILYA